MRGIVILTFTAILSVGPALAQQGGDQGGMMQGGQGGMMGGQRAVANLKNLPPERAVQEVRYCKGQYFVGTAAGDVLEFPEFNLRIKTDASDDGPAEGKPALIPAGMMSDRAFLVFTQPGEISGYIKNKCS